MQVVQLNQRYKVYRLQDEATVDIADAIAWIAKKEHLIMEIQYV